MALVDPRDGKAICHLSTNWCELYAPADTSESIDLRLTHPERGSFDRKLADYLAFRHAHAKHRFVAEPQ